jgi:hypothetical protein
MKSTIMMVLLMASPAAPAMGDPGTAAASASKESIWASQDDPLIRQIRHQQLTKPNGGVATVAFIASGQPVDLTGPDADAKPAEELRDALNSGDPLAGLKPAAGLVAAKERPAPTSGSKAVKPTEQLKAISKTQKWGEAVKAGAEKPRPAEAKS